MIHQSFVWSLKDVWILKVSCVLILSTLYHHVILQASFYKFPLAIIVTPTWTESRVIKWHFLLQEKSCGLLHFWSKRSLLLYRWTNVCLSINIQFMNVTIFAVISLQLWSSIYCLKIILRYRVHYLVYMIQYLVWMKKILYWKLPSPQTIHQCLKNVW